MPGKSGGVEGDVRAGAAVWGECGTGRWELGERSCLLPSQHVWLHPCPSTVRQGRPLLSLPLSFIPPAITAAPARSAWKAVHEVFSELCRLWHFAIAKATSPLWGRISLTAELHAPLGSASSVSKAGRLRKGCKPIPTACPCMLLAAQLLRHRRWLPASACSAPK